MAKIVAPTPPARATGAADPPVVLPPVDPEWAALHTVHYRFLSNQQNMLEDSQRTGHYRMAITGNKSDFEGRTVLDVGAGTGVLSIFAAQARARKVYAIEGTHMAVHAQRLIDGVGLSDRIEIVQGRLSEISLPVKVDVIVSEPWGFFLFHERMVEAFLLARDRFLAPGGKLFPGTARLWLAPFIDQSLYDMRTRCAAFWRQTDFFGVDLSTMADVAAHELFAMPVLGPVNPQNLMASPAIFPFDFGTMKLGELAEIRLPFEFVSTHVGPLHGIVGWFDVTFEGTDRRVVLSTAPDQPRTHWTQLRFVFVQPPFVNVGDVLRGSLLLRANAQSSYDAAFEGEIVGKMRLPEQTFYIHTYFYWEASDAAP
jgi:histone-arginine methyltransferase CARM1